MTISRCETRMRRLTIQSPPAGLLVGCPVDVEVVEPIARPGTSSSTCCVVSPSGRAADLDDLSHEVDLCRSLADELGRRGVTTIRPSVPRRVDLGLAASRAEIAERARRLAVILGHAADDDPGRRVVVAGFSLGGTVLAEIAAHPVMSARIGIDLAVLVGCVLDRPYATARSIARVELVYGEHDLLGVGSGPDACMSLVGPVDYGPDVARCFQGTPSTGVHVVPDHHHLLEPSQPGSLGAEDGLRRAVVLLADLIATDEPEYAPTPRCSGHGGRQRRQPAVEGAR